MGNDLKQNSPAARPFESGIVIFMTSEPHVLVVEDDREIRTLIIRLLRTNGYRATPAGDGREMQRALDGARIDLVLLDVMLPGEDGLSLCRRLRDASRVPVIILSAKGEEIDRVLGLEFGADDYITKPFNPRELLARLKAVLRRAAPQEHDGEPGAAAEYRFAGWRLDCVRRRVLDPAGASVAITDAEFDLLRVLCMRPHKLLSRDQLIDLTQGRAAHPTERSVDILVARLRRKMAHEQLDPDFIRTVRSGGYIFTLDVEAEGGKA